MKVATWNVNGIRARAAEVRDFVQRVQPDVLCLQEVKASPEQVPDELRTLPGYWARWHGHKGYSGVALLLSQSFFPDAPEFGHPEFDHETRIATARAGDLVLASVYVPNGGKDFEAKLRFVEAMNAWAKALAVAGTPLLLCGDLNIAREERDVHPSLRTGKKELIGTTPKERTLFGELLEGSGLTDLQRHFAPDDDRLFTWWAPWRNLRQKNVGWRIDYVLASAALSPAAKACAVERETGSSDHGPLVAELDLPPRPRTQPLPAAEPQPEPAPEPPRGPGQLPLL